MTRRSRVPSPTTTRSRSPERTPSCAAARLLNTIASGANRSSARRSTSPMSTGCSVAATNGSRPSTLRVSAVRGQRRFELEHGTRRAHGGIPRELAVQALGKSVARPADHDVGIAHQALGRQAELVECRRVDEIDRGRESHPEGDRQHRDREPAAAARAVARAAAYGPGGARRGRGMACSRRARPGRKTCGIEDEDAVGGLGGGPRVRDENPRAGACLDLIAQQARGSGRRCAGRGSRWAHRPAPGAAGARGHARSPRAAPLRRRARAGSGPRQPRAPRRAAFQPCAGCARPRRRRGAREAKRRFARR